MIEQKTAFKIGFIIVMLLLLAWFASIPSVMRGDWTFHQFIKDYLTGIVMGTLCALPYWLILRFVKRE